MYQRPQIMRTIIVPVSNDNAVYSDAWSHSHTWNHSVTSGGSTILDGADNVAHFVQ